MMWITRTEHERLLTAAAQIAPLEARIASQTTMIEWLRLRLNQCEQERAALLAGATQTRLPAPMIERTGEPRSPLDARPDPVNPDNFLAQIGSIFDDVGDEMAHKMGLAHDEAGALVYTK